MAKHLRVHLQSEIAEDVVLDPERSLEASDEIAFGLEEKVYVVAVALLVDRIGEAARTPLVYLDNLPVVLFNEFADAIDEPADLVVVENAVNDVGELVGVLSHKFPSGIIGVGLRPPSQRRAGTICM